MLRNSIFSTLYTQINQPLLRFNGAYLGARLMRKMIKRLFVDHPASVGESYVQHLFTASHFAVRMVIGGVACFLHGIFPFLCTKTGSAIICELQQTMITHRASNRVIEKKP